MKTTTTIILAAIALLLASCKQTEYVAVPVVMNDTIYQTRVQTDSIHVHDSIYIKEYMRGDTVFRDRWQWRTQYRDRLRIDTLIRHSVDSIPYPVEVVREVPAILSPWQHFCQWFTYITLGLLCLAFFVWIWKTK